MSREGVMKLPMREGDRSLCRKRRDDPSLARSFSTMRDGPILLYLFHKARKAAKYGGKLITTE